MRSGRAAGLNSDPDARVTQPSHTGILVIDGPVDASDVPRLCSRLCAVLRDCDAEVVVCDVRTLAADAITLEALARLQLTARILGRGIRLQRASPDLGRLVAFVGLDDVLPCRVARDHAL